MATRSSDAVARSFGTTSDALFVRDWEKYLVEDERMGKVLRNPAPNAAAAAVPTGEAGMAKGTDGAPSKPYSDPLLNERETTHGDFGRQTETVQGIKELMRSAPNWKKLSPAKRESLELIATKIGRILHGDYMFKDSWDDIAGYAKLVAERLPF